MLEFDENNNVITEQDQLAILVGLSTGEDISYSMDELEGLAEADGIAVAGRMVQNAERVNAATFIGSGKLKELAELCANMGANLVIFNDELSGMQLRNIEDETGVKVIDRTILILDIFADRATSMEGKLQVEMAQLQYRMPRLLGFGKALSRLGGGIGTRGPGEKKLETDRRHIQKRLDEIRSELKTVKANRAVQRSKMVRSGIPVVALVGYTNSGKSSIMNRFLEEEDREEKQVFEKDMLFATLDTARRQITLDSRRSFILVDTVGFVSKLPHALVEAFKATLEEAVTADLLLHVVDASFPESDFHIEVTDRVLSELGAKAEPVLVYNKTDLVPGFVPVGRAGSVCVSAKTGEGFDELIQIISDRLFSDMKLVELSIPYGRGDLVSFVLGKAKPEKVEYREDSTYIKVELDGADRGRLSEFII